MTQRYTIFVKNKPQRMCFFCACGDPIGRNIPRPMGETFSETFHLRTQRRMPSPFYAPCGAGRSMLRPYRNPDTLMPHSECHPLENQRFRCETVPSRAHSRPRPALSLGSESAGRAARYMIGVGFSLGMPLRGVRWVRFCPRSRIWGARARPGGCFFRSNVSSLCPVCVHFQTVRNYVGVCALQDFVPMCPLFPVGLGVL